MGVFYMFLSESDYDSLCTFPLQLSSWLHSQFFPLADYLLRYICDCICNFSHLQIISALYLWLHSHFFSFADYLLRHTCDRIHNFSHLQIISCAILWPHSQFFPLADYLCSILVTAFALFLICRLSLLYTCDRIHTFFHLQIISALYLWPHSQFFPFVDYLCSILVTAFTIFPICRLSLLYTCDCIRTFFHLQIISCATPPLRLCWGCLQAGLSRVWTGILARLA